MFKVIAAVCFIILGAFQSYAQELICTVDIQSQQIQGVDKRYFDNLKIAITEFMNNTKWTKDIFKQEERIECSITLIFKEKIDNQEFKGSMQVVSRRPVYKSSYSSVLLNHLDEDIQIKYVEFQQMQFDENTFNSNLTSLFAYYAYVILALDYDSFSLNGGSPYWVKAQKIVALAQNTPEKGWRSFDANNNRYWLVENIISNNVFTPLRECIYKYHRLGLDVMSDNAVQGRAVILQNLEGLKAIHKVRPVSFNMNVFFYAKADEVVNIFKQADAAERTKVSALLTEINPGNANKYQKIMQQ